MGPIEFRAVDANGHKADSEHAPVYWTLSSGGGVTTVLIREQDQQRETFLDRMKTAIWALENWLETHPEKVAQ